MNRLPLNFACWDYDRMRPTLVSIANHCLDLDCFKKSHPLQQTGSPGFK